MLIEESKISEIADDMEKNNIDIAIIGPEMSLVLGITDELEKKGIGVFGPNKKGAQIEGSKFFARNLMAKYHIKGNIPYKRIEKKEDVERAIKNWEGPFVIKPIGLTAGKGVKVWGDHFTTLNEAIKYGYEIFDSKIGGSEGFIIENKVDGEEFTLQAVVDGNNASFFPLVQDHKRLLEDDRGVNTGGMGSYSFSDGKLPFVKETHYKEAVEIMKETINALGKEGIKYKGILYGSFMETPTGPFLIEYNCRFGDPEGINTLNSIKTDFMDIVKYTIEGKLNELNIQFNNVSTVCKYIVPKGYGVNPVYNKPLQIDEEIYKISNLKIYFASVNEIKGVIHTTTSRAIALLGIGNTIEEAEKVCQKGIELIKGEIYYRKDIGTPELINKRISHMEKLNNK
jgi:phosphoribosylamine--glycine ligase